MKLHKTFLKCTALLLFFSSQVLAADNSNALNLLKSMERAEDTLNFERIFLQITPNDIESLRYRHSRAEGVTYAQLVNLEGSRQEIVQRDNLVAYLNQSTNVQPFTIQSKQIVESLPIRLKTDFDQLSRYYDFIDAGRNRVADHLVQVVKILPKDNFRYQYVLFIDETSHLLLRADLLDRDGLLLEQFRAVSLQVGDEFLQLAQYLTDFRFPPLVISDAHKPVSLNWQAGWLPQGFKAVKSMQENYADSMIESEIYSDGLFTFTLYLAPSELPERYDDSWSQGMHTMYTESRQGREITIIGQIPPATAKRIVQEVQFKQ